MFFNLGGEGLSWKATGMRIWSHKWFLGDSCSLFKQGIPANVVCKQICNNWRRATYYLCLQPCHSTFRENAEEQDGNIVGEAHDSETRLGVCKLLIDELKIQESSEGKIDLARFEMSMCSPSQAFFTEVWKHRQFFILLSYLLIYYFFTAQRLLSPRQVLSVFYFVFWFDLTRKYFRFALSHR